MSTATAPHAAAWLLGALAAVGLLSSAVAEGTVLPGRPTSGLLAETTDLRGALLAVAALALVFTVAATPINIWAAHRVGRCRA